MVFVLMGRAPPSEHVENDTIPRLSVELINFPWGVQAEVTIDPWGRDGWTWDNPDFYPSFFCFSMDLSTPDIGSGFGAGIAMKGKNVIYRNITNAFCCDTCLYGVYAVATNGSCYVVAKIVEDSGDRPTGTGLDFSLDFKNGLTVYIQSPDGDLPEIDSVGIGSVMFSRDGQEMGGSGGETSVLYRNETHVWCEPFIVGNQNPGDLNASVLWFCRALGKDGTIYWNPVNLAYFGDPPTVITQPEGWP